ncbi:hypothetical protein MLD38_025523 [Melastoma candidum]|uniref:Uncharacterized protein n=1 Tax=Melastoma candidum TaxID=119954 RepID=A0ACB9NX14_9MYRT|nr:hypothetical protein MLD38_025523 [Melastoma candidum]
MGGPLHLQTDLRAALHVATSAARSLSVSFPCAVSFSVRLLPLGLRAFSARVSSSDVLKALEEKPPLCTADELHYVSVPNSGWRLALWRYLPSPQAPARNHPLLLLSGVGTNAIGYDLSPDSSFARYMSGEGFDTWILEVRGAGLSIYSSASKDIKKTARERNDLMEAVAQSGNNCVPAEQTEQNLVNGASLLIRQEFQTPTIEPEGLSKTWDQSTLVSELTETFMRLSERLSGFLSEGQLKIMSAKLFDRISKLLEEFQLSEHYNEIRVKLSNLLEESSQGTAISSQIKDLSERLVNIIDEGQRSVSPPLFNLQERFYSTIEDFQKQLDLIVMYDWDFDHYLDEDVPAAMEYVNKVTKPKDGKLLAIGHSMGGILLYARLSRCAFEERDPQLKAIVTLASSLDYTSSKSALKLLLPLADPAQALNVPVVPLGAMLSAAYPLSSQPPYVLSWLTNLISAQDMMQPELLKKLVLNNFGTIPAKLILQLTTAFKAGGLSDRWGKFFYKNYMHKINVPILALAGDEDLICPPEAVEETVKIIPEDLISYKVLGGPDGPHYAHYDLVGGRLAVQQVYPCIVEFLSTNDGCSE